jgi:translocation protein SEC63
MPLATTDYPCRSLFIILGWVAFSLLAYKVSTTKIDNKIYDPFEILGIKSVSPKCLTSIRFWPHTPFPPNLRCAIQYLTSRSSVEYPGKGHQVSLQKTFQNIVSFPFFDLHSLAHYLHSHPDKVKLTGNDTADSVAARFVEITKAYKAYAVIYRTLPDLT